MAKEHGVGLGKANYCLKDPIDKGWVKVNYFRNSERKSAYAYLPTASGLEEEAKITERFLKQRMLEYEHIKCEIAELEAEVRGELGVESDKGH